MILQQAMNEIHVGADHLAVAADTLNNVIAMMHDEFQIERGDVAASVAAAGGAASNGLLLIFKSGVSRLDQLDQRFAARQFGLRRVGEDSVAFQFGQSE